MTLSQAQTMAYMVLPNELLSKTFGSTLTFILSMEHQTHCHLSYDVTSGDAHLHSVPLWLLPTSVVKHL